jgi:hypothetical protein
MLTPRFLEGMNGTLFLLVVFACVMFGIYIVREIRRNGFQRTRLQGAISIFAFMIGEAMIRGWIWYWRHTENSGGNVEWMLFNPILAVGAFVQILGVICVIRVFAPDQWGRNMWVVTSFLAVTLGLVFALVS